ncbi:MAG: glycosyltransferase [Actinomycetota bacterium]|nr:glycosyltransferase [Actinomycetota bacterium]
MKVLFASVPGVGHFHPLVPLALALVEAGDDVLVAAGPSICARAEGMGLAATPVGPDYDAWSAKMRSRVRGVPGDGLAPERIMRYFLPRLFCEVGAPLMVDELVTLVASWQPDLVVYETCCFAAPLAAAVAGVPAVHHTVSPLLPLATYDLAADALSPLWRSFALAPPPLGGLFEGLTLATWPASLDTPEEYKAFDIGRLQPVPLDAGDGEGLPGWMGQLPGRPTIYMTLGTVMNSALEVFRAVLDGLADEALNVIVTVGHGNDPAALGDIPANAHIEAYIPQSLLLGSCAVVISHGGSGTTLAALAHGLPQLLIPQGGDQFENAQRCEQAGVALCLMPEDVTADAVRDSIATLLGSDSPYARAAVSLRAEMSTMPTPKEWVPRLHALASSQGHLSNGAQVANNSSTALPEGGVLAK